MGKSSSIVKKSRHKSSSQSGSRKKSKKSRSRRDRLKKNRRSDSSISCSDNDDSRSLSSVSYSSSEDDYRRSKRSRSRTRKDGKGFKKSRSSRSRKRKGLKRKGDSDVGKKTYLKKKRKKKVRRDASVSSSSGRSRSCSSSDGKSSSDDKSDFESDMDRNGMKENDRRSLEGVRRGIKRSRYRSKSLSSCSQRSESNDYQYGEEVMNEKIPGRLRSVIVVKQEEEGGELDEDEHKEETVYGRDDYPPCRSNDSNEGGSKRDLSQHSHLASEERKRVDIEKEEEVVVSNIQTSKLIESGKDARSNLRCDGVGKKDHMEKNETESDAIDNPDYKDLESMLRQRALENLKSFRGGIQRNAKCPPFQKDTNVSALKQPSSEKADLVQINYVKEDGVRMVDKTEAIEQSNILAPVRDSTSLRARALDNLETFREGLEMNAKCPATQQDTNVSAVKQPPTRKFGSVQLQSTKEGGVRLVGKTQIVEPINIPEPNDKKSSFQSDGDCKSLSAKQDVAITSTQSEKVNMTVGPDANKPKLAISELRGDSSKTRSTLNNAPASERSPKGNYLSERTVEKTDIRSSNNKEELNSLGGSLPEPLFSPKSASRSFSSNKQQDEGKDDSQYEQKTMSVMRGGEMVQVSYKVYIPKKTPALARRQLKR